MELQDFLLGISKPFFSPHLKEDVYKLVSEYKTPNYVQDFRKSLDT